VRESDGVYRGWDDETRGKLFRGIFSECARVSVKGVRVYNDGGGGGGVDDGM